MAIYVTLRHKFGLFGLDLGSFFFKKTNIIKGVLGSFCKNRIGGRRGGCYEKIMRSASCRPPRAGSPFPPDRKDVRSSIISTRRSAATEDGASPAKIYRYILHGVI